jgi:hypothetical protein
MVNRRLVESTIIEMLSRNGAQDYPSILRFIKDRFEELTEQELSKALMTLEIRGILRVYSAAKDKQRVELVRG